ncbi:bifunctional 4-hydroxy-2-oxoglutarate aldolase/2-dehydro-3-deoxy-phosphogluconate aldolase [Aurantivibrio plasticivorans]
MNYLAKLLQELRIIPVLTVNSAEDAIDVCRSLQAGGINVAEITLRTAAAWDAISAVKETLSDFYVAAGTIKTGQDIEKLAALGGVAFAVSPGLSLEICDAATENDIHLLPGVATPSELMAGLETGRQCFKLFPAEAVGGMALLKSLASPFSEALFCPTGGVNPSNYQQYLSLSNVVAIGGSWMVAPELIHNQQWDQITELSREAVTAA